MKTNDSNFDFRNREWSEFNLKEIFPKVQRGKRLKKGDHVKGKTPYVSSTSNNNGVDAYVGNKENVRVFSNCLSLANSGSVGASFYQPFSFVASDHITKLENPKFNRYVYLFVAALTNRLGEKYSFNREINDARLQREKILLPVDSRGKPDFGFMEAFIKFKENEILKRYYTYINNRLNQVKKVKSLIPLNEKGWREFQLTEIFDIISGVRLTKANMKTGKKPFIGASDSNNGITAFVSNTNTSEDSKVLGVNYNGSVAENFYHPYTALFSDDVKRLRFKNIKGNRHLYLFMKTQILKQKSKYQYGYKFNSTRMSKQKIMLPVNEVGEPDYIYMENYMKNLEVEILRKYISKRKSITD